MTQIKSFRGILYHSKADLLAGIIAEWNSGTNTPFPGSPAQEADAVIDFFTTPACGFYLMRGKGISISKAQTADQSGNWLAEHGLTHNDLVAAIADKA